MLRLLCLASAFLTAFFGVVVLALAMEVGGLQVSPGWLCAGAPLLVAGVVLVETWLVEPLLGQRPGQRVSRVVISLVSAAGVSAGVIPAGFADALPWRLPRIARGSPVRAAEPAWLYEDADGLVRLAKDLDHVPPRYRASAHPLDRR
ncbi:MAG: hypothetical protein JNJ54_09910 [Myxococcaceae bacterium]|nr:hypothetical protein [Myxococcaceae bacterium]